MGFMHSFPEIDEMKNYSTIELTSSVVLTAYNIYAVK